MNDTAINVFLSLACLAGSLLVFFLPFLKHRKEGIAAFTKSHVFLLVASMVLLVGSLFRVLLLDKLPSGLNQDEASAGYEAYSIMTYGKDRNGMQYPVHLIAWGSGQNALYSYLAMPFLLIFGNTAFALRLPMALIGVFSLYALYYTLKSCTDEKISLLLLTFLAINPWHIMKSRWALESNLFPDLVLYGTLLLLLALKKRRYVAFYLSAVVLGLSSYSYGTSYFFLFFFVLAFLVYLLVKKTYAWYHVLGYLGTVFVVCLPIILFLYINFFDKETIHLLWFDIPKLKTDRFHSVTSLFSEDFFKTGTENLVNGFSLLISQNDGLPWNYTPYFGVMYYLTLPFSIVGLLHGLFLSKEEKMKWKSKENYKAESGFLFLLRDWLMVSLLMMFILSSNINRINIVWLPLILFGAIGIADTITLVKSAIAKRVLSFALPTLYLSFFIGFSAYYPYWNKKEIGPSFYESFPEALAYANSLNPETTYVSSRANYTLVLYYTKYDVNRYLDTVDIVNPGAAFEAISSFEGYSFSLPRLEAGNAYIVYNGDLEGDDPVYTEAELSSYPIKQFRYYSVIDTTDHE